VRPTTERVRAAIFNILDIAQYRDRRVLDLFAGTGSMGIEALSRGAAWADFVERDRRQCAVIRENLATTGFGPLAEVRQGDATRTGSMGIEALSRGAAWADFVERDRRQCAVIRENLATTGFGPLAEVRQGDATRTLPLLPGGYGLILLDPPYRMGAFHCVLEAISQQPGLLSPQGMVVAGHSRQTELLAAYGKLRRVVFRQYGDNSVAFYLNEPGRKPDSSGEISGAAAE
jgi:16S rRNA (guanine(966)-N(2))-methyltransferase RsmD